ncbi:isoleucine--tRNA ligase ISM1 [Sporobolomyces salmoneus]|uniref:isoleucine--tRNA ligase ISM1 n=1 Tax=Sporobolomyces salmoneus TaxID=183962 RepID=UPI003177914E
MLLSHLPRRIPLSPSVALPRPFSTSLPNHAKSPKKPKDALSQYYSESLNLPKTAFPLRAEAAKREKLFWKRTTEDLYEWQSKQTERPLFVLHDGPPYANGNLHCGHALNKITKDIINRSKLIQGYRIHYVPGFDTHGLPLELKALSALKKPASSLTAQEIRSAARKEAEKGIELQKGEFKSFAVMGDWDNPYKTMDWSYEKRQLGVVKDMVGKGLIVSHNRPTLYSPSSRTALAEAELEYRDDHVSRSVYVAFPVASLGEGLETAFEAMKIDLREEKISLAAWTTTPWTLPSNLAIAVSPAMEYSLVRREDSNELLIVASERIAALAEIFETSLKLIAQCLGSSLLSTTYTSVLNSPSASSSVPQVTRPIIPADYVTATTGTGLVHTSPAHGIEDFESYRSFQSTLSADSPFRVEDIYSAVDGEGKLDSNLDKFGLEPEVVERLKGKNVLGDGVQGVIEILQERDTLLKEVQVTHKFPYDWRTKKPVIFRASSQWFANLENVKDDAVKVLERVNFFPSRGSRTLEMYVRGRSEWCISRQRAWGVPIPVVYRDSPTSGSVPLLTPSNIDHIVSVLEKNGGTDYWWTGSAEGFVEPAELERAEREGGGVTWRKGADTLDVWFDSGCSWTLLREQGVRSSEREGVLADVYFEGSDQHRGWFQSSLLTKIASTREGEEPVAPYKDVITHGMVLDDKGRKMSKSLGNVISPDTVIKGGKNSKLEPAYGTDLLRIWVASVDSTRDVLIGPGILAQTFDGFRKIRNTARFLLGNIGQEKVEDFDSCDLGLIERFVLHELFTLDQTVREAFSTYQFNRAYQALSNFSNSTLSSFYFDVTKDTLYADARTTLARRQVIYTLQKVFDTYLSILSPLAPLLAEEIYHFSRGATKDPSIETDRGESVFEKKWPQPSKEWNDPVVKSEMEELLGLRTEVMSLLEQARNDKNIGSSAEARVILTSPSETVRKHLDVLKTLFIVSDVSIEEQVPSKSAWQYASSASDSSATRAIILPSLAAKCPRCWQFTVKPTAKPITIETETPSPPVCARCSQALGN